MIQIFYNVKYDRLELKFTDWLDPVDFHEYAELFKSIHIYYNNSINKFSCPISKIDELHITLQKEQIQFEYVNIDDIEKWYLKQYPNEVKYYRNIQIDETILNPDIKLFDFQKKVIKFHLSRNRVWDCLSPGLGKGNLLTSNILTSIGWKKMKDVKVGDLIIGKNGKSTKVTGVFPLGKVQCYKVTMSDGSFTEVSDEHIWSVQTKDERGKYKHLNKWKNVITKDIKDDLYGNDGRKKYSIPMVKSVEFKEQNLFLHPYVMGVLLGDGCMSQNYVILSNSEKDIINKVGNLLPDDLFLKLKTNSIYEYKILKKERKGNQLNSLVSYLKDLNLLGSKSNSKFIPDIYKFNSVENRVFLLQGLLDTDGYIQGSKVGRKGCRIEYGTVSERLKNDVVFLVQSLGGTCSIKTKVPTYKYKNEKKTGQLFYILTIRLPNDIVPISSKKHLEKFEEKTKYFPVRYITSIEDIGYQEAQCIKVDAKDELYVTDDFIVTHNTAISLYSMSYLFKNNKIDKLLIVVPIGLDFHWKHSFLQFVNVFTEDDFSLVTNEEKNQAFTKYKDKKIIIVQSHMLNDIVLTYDETYQKSIQKTHSMCKKCKKKVEVIKKRKEFYCKECNNHIKSLSMKNISIPEYLPIAKILGSEKLGIIVDEVHQFKYTHSNRTKALNSIIPDFDHRYFLTATPFIQKIEHAYSNTAMLDKSSIRLSEKGFKLWIGNEFDRYGNIVKYNQESVNDFLNSIKHIFIKLNKDDIEESIFKNNVKPIYLDLHQIQKELYVEFVNSTVAKLLEKYNKLYWNIIQNFLDPLIKVIDNPLLLKKETFSNDNINTLLNKWKPDYDPKMNMLHNRIKEYVDEEKGKVVVFCQHRDNLSYLADKYSKYNPILIHGLSENKDKSKIRDEKRRKFNSDPSCKIAFLSFLTSSAGGNWNESCNRIIFYSTPWDSTLYKQALERTDRIDSIQDSYTDIFNYPISLDATRLERAQSRTELNEKLGKEIDIDDLQNLLKGITQKLKL